MTTVNTSALRAAFEHLRRAWFLLQLRVEAESLHETDDEVRRRVEYNERVQAAYDRQTALLICGDTTIPVAPLNQDSVLRAAAASPLAREILAKAKTT